MSPAVSAAPLPPEPLAEYSARVRADLADHRDHDPLEHAVFTALGAASACWENLRGAGVFESERAKAVGDELVSFLRSRGVS